MNNTFNKISIGVSVGRFWFPAVDSFNYSSASYILYFTVIYIINTFSWEYIFHSAYYNILSDISLQIENLTGSNSH